MRFASGVWPILFVLLLALWAVRGGAGEFSDTEGFRWDIQGDGSINDGSNDTFDGGLHLLINGQRLGGGQQSVSADGREVVTIAQGFAGLNVTRKARVSEKMPGCRFLEIIENPTGQPVQLQLSIYSNLGGGAQGSSLPESKDGRVPYVALEQGQGNRSSLAYCMASTKGQLLVQSQVQGQNVVLTYDPMTLKPNERVAILHYCAQRRSLADAETFAKKLNWAAVVRDLDRGDRALVRNVRTGGGLLSLGGIELFRGESGDAIRLESGELLTGQLQLPVFSIETEFGARNVPSDQVLSLFEAGEDVRLVCQNGEVLTGKLKTQALTLKLRGGQEIDVPVDYIAKYGKRLPQAKAAKENDSGEVEVGEQFTFTDPVFVLRSGDRLVGKPTAEKLEFVTLYGPLSVGRSELKRITFPHAELRTPVVELKDGASFSAFPAGGSWSVQRSTGAPVLLDAGRLSAIFFVPGEELKESGNDQDAETEPEQAPVPQAYAQLRLLNQDLFCGTLSAAAGPLTMDTPFGKQRVGVDQIMRLKPRLSGPYRLRVTLWDGNVFPARLAENTIDFTTNGGAQLKVPLGMLSLYWRPLALPPAEEVTRIEGLIAKLGDNDPQAREAAQKMLSEIGNGARLLLSKHWKDEDLETRTRVRRLLDRLQETAPSETLEDEEDDESSLQAPAVRPAAPGSVQPVPMQMRRRMVIRG